MSSNSVRVTGLSRLQNKLTKMIDTMDSTVNSETFQLAKKIMKESDEMCPKDTGALVDSSYVKVDEGGVVGGYGKPGSINSKTGIPVVDYMVEVHEDMEVFHRNGQAKFLEIAFYNNIDDLGDFEERLVRKICK